ncbi:MAG: hypothetical protein ACAH95_01170 [Fimbriimonas sp.]
MTRSSRIALGAALAALLGGCTPTPEAQPPKVTSAPPKVVAPAGPTILEGKGAQIKASATEWIAKWSFEAPRPVNLSGSFGEVNVKFDTTRMSEQVGDHAVSGTITLTLKREPTETNSSIQVMEMRKDGEPPSYSTYYTGKPPVLAGKLNEVLRSDWKEGSKPIPSEWVLFSYKEKGAWHPVKFKVAYPAESKPTTAPQFQGSVK